jgi:hypothetical protein
VASIGGRGAFLVLLLPALTAYLVAVNFLSGKRASSMAPELSVRLPLAAQVVMAGGDRHLAANLAGFRVLVADTIRMKQDEFHTQAQLQKDISWLNPAHEDNYYIAAAILSEPPLIPAAQYVLRRAADARPRDWLPLFYYGFNLYHFEKNPVAGAAALLEGVQRTNDIGEQWGLQALAARWIERGYRTDEAARLVGEMARSAPPGGFKRYLSMRQGRLMQLERLRKLAGDFKAMYGRPLSRIEELVEKKLIDQLPVDPLKVGFAVDPAGEPVFRDAIPAGGR